MMDDTVMSITDYERREKKRPRFETMSTTALMAIEFPPIRWIVPGYLAGGPEHPRRPTEARQDLAGARLGDRRRLRRGGHGLGQCASREMSSTSTWRMATAASRPASGRCFRTTGRDRTSRGSIGSTAPVSSMRDFSRRWMTGALPSESPRLVVIDVFQRVKPVGSKSRNAYENDYAALAPLQHWATEHGVAVLCLHHTRKGGADDPLEALSGSNGLSACADTTLVLDRDQNGVTLYVRGRDVEEKESALNFLSGLWSLIGDAAEVKKDGRAQSDLIGTSYRGRTDEPC